MTLYIDTSFLLAVLFRDPQQPDLVDIWEKHDSRISSILLHAEGVTTVRRLGQGKGVEKLLEELIREVSLRVVDSEILAVLRAERALAGCRTLDALHLATAMEFSHHTGVEPIVCSLDQRLRSVAACQGFEVLPP